MRDKELQWYRTLMITSSAVLEVLGEWRKRITVEFESAIEKRQYNGEILSSSPD
jgi:hypothetical protein